MVECAPPGDAGRAGRRGQDPAARRGRPSAAARATGPAGGAVRAGDGRRGVGGRCRRRRPRHRRPARCAARRARSRPCSATPRSWCWWTTASTSSSRSPRSSISSSPAARTCAVVATSRERLRVPGEQVCAVPTLPVDGEDSAAVRLFVERARAVVPGFEPDAARAGVRGGDRAAASTGCRWRSSWPRPACTPTTSREVAAGLDHRFSLLSSGYRTSSRHASLGAAVSWSFGLLDEQLQAALRRPVGVRRVVHARPTRPRSAPWMTSTADAQRWPSSPSVRW